MKTEVENSNSKSHTWCAGAGSGRELICICICIKSKSQQPPFWLPQRRLLFHLSPAAGDDKLPAAFLERKKRLEHIVKLLLRYILKQKQ